MATIPGHGGGSKRGLEERANLPDAFRRPAEVIAMWHSMGKCPGNKHGQEQLGIRERFAFLRLKACLPLEFAIVVPGICSSVWGNATILPHQATSNAFDCARICSPFTQSNVCRLSLQDLDRVAIGLGRAGLLDEARAAWNEISKQNSNLIDEVGHDQSQRFCGTAPFNVCVHKVTDNAKDCWEQFRDCNDVGLYQVQIAHDACPSLLFNIQDAFNDFLLETSATCEGYPGNLDVLETDFGVRLVLTDRNDSEQVDFVQSTS